MLHIIIIMLTLSTVGATLQAGEVRDLVTELDLASCRLVIMEPRLAEVTRAWTEARTSLCTQLPCYSSTLASKLHFPSGVTLVLLDDKCSDSCAQVSTMSGGQPVSSPSGGQSLPRAQSLSAASVGA